MRVFSQIALNVEGRLVDSGTIVDVSADEAETLIGQGHAVPRDHVNADDLARAELRANVAKRDTSRPMTKTTAVEVETTEAPAAPETTEAPLVSGAPKGRGKRSTK